MPEELDVLVAARPGDFSKLSLVELLAHRKATRGLAADGKYFERRHALNDLIELEEVINLRLMA